MLKRRWILGLLALLPMVVLAWGKAGHYVIAAIAYQHLTPATKQVVDRYSRSFSRSRSPQTRFIMMSYWADTLKQQGVDDFSKWHYLPYPYIQQGVEGKRYPRKSLMWAVRYNEYQLQHNRSEKKRARALAFLVHIVGDAHQPMHCINLFNKRFPRGDSGGNAYKIKAKAGDSLHEFWDNGGGMLVMKRQSYRRYMKRINELAKQLQQQHPWQTMQSQMTEQNPKVWTQDGYQLAVKDAYSLPYGAKVSAAYIKQAKAVSAKQLVLAGYRLAYWLNHHLGEKHDA